MVRAFIFIFLYGATVLTSLFLALFWAKMAFNRKREIHWPWSHDRYFMLASGISICATGLFLIDAGRLYGNIVHGLSRILERGEAWVIGTGLIILAFGGLGLVRLADMETDPATWAWTKLIAATSVVWLVATFFIVPHVPFVKV